MTEAYVTLATNDKYALGALVLGHSLRSVNTTKHLCILVTPDVSEPIRSQLSSLFDNVTCVNVLDSNDSAHLALTKRPELGVTFTKLHCWTLTQYKKCVFLDADMMAVQNADELFEHSELSAACDIGWPDCFNSGMFVFSPSQETYNRLLDHAENTGSFDGGDQGLLNTFFSDWTRLSFVYNTVASVSYTYLPAYKQFGQDVKFIHFLGATKPWQQSFHTDSGTVVSQPGQEHISSHLNAWWRIFASKVKPGLPESVSSPVTIASQPEDHHSHHDHQQPQDVEITFGTLNIHENHQQQVIHTPSWEHGHPYSKSHEQITYYPSVHHDIRHQPVHSPPGFHEHRHEHPPAHPSPVIHEHPPPHPPPVYEQRHEHFPPPPVYEQIHEHPPPPHVHEQRHEYPPPPPPVYEQRHEHPGPPPVIHEQRHEHPPPPPLVYEQRHEHPPSPHLHEQRHEHPPPPFPVYEQRHEHPQPPPVIHEQRHEHPTPPPIIHEQRHEHPLPPPLVMQKEKPKPPQQSAHEAVHEQPLPPPIVREPPPQSTEIHKPEHEPCITRDQKHKPSSARKQKHEPSPSSPISKQKAKAPPPSSTGKESKHTKSRASKTSKAHQSSPPPRKTKDKAVKYVDKATQTTESDFADSLREIIANIISTELKRSQFQMSQLDPAQMSKKLASRPKAEFYIESETDSQPADTPSTDLIISRPTPTPPPSPSKITTAEAEPPSALLNQHSKTDHTTSSKSNIDPSPIVPATPSSATPSSATPSSATPSSATPLPHPTKKPYRPAYYYPPPPPPPPPPTKVVPELRQTPESEGKPGLMRHPARSTAFGEGRGPLAPKLASHFSPLKCARRPSPFSELSAATAVSAQGPSAEVAGPFEGLHISTPPENIHDSRKRWEQGQPDFRGKDSFDNILAHIDSKINNQ